MHNDESIRIPYDVIAYYICLSYFPLLVGILIQRIFPRFPEISEAILKGISIPILVFVIIIAIMREFHALSTEPFTITWKV